MNSNENILVVWIERRSYSDYSRRDRKKLFSSALPRMEAVCEVVDLKLEAKVVEEDDGSVSAPFSTIRLLLLPL